MELKTLSIQCPYCWQAIEILVDPSISTQDYIEDCSVCCQPVQVKIAVGSDGEPQAEAFSQDD